jgi:hypothetical protein
MPVRSAPDPQHQHWMETHGWYQQSQDTWRKIPNPGMVSPNGYPSGNPHEVANAIAICDRALRSGSARAD